MVQVPLQATVYMQQNVSQKKLPHKARAAASRGTARAASHTVTRSAGWQALHHCSYLQLSVTKDMEAASAISGARPADSTCASAAQPDTKPAAGIQVAADVVHKVLGTTKPLSHITQVCNAFSSY
jgi:hypothetical protein